MDLEVWVSCSLVSRIAGLPRALARDFRIGSHNNSAKIRVPTKRRRSKGSWNSATAIAANHPPAPIMSSRPAQYSPQYTADDPFNTPSSFDLPLFNPYPPSNNLPSIRTDEAAIGSNRQAQFPSSHLPPPNNGSASAGGGHSGHQQRHSVAYGSSAPTYDLSSPQTAAPTHQGSPAHHHRQGSVSSALPYTSPYANSRHAELMPPPSASTAFSLGRSASLGTRRKDPYSYSPDDVESGLGQMDMKAESTWPVYGEEADTRGRQHSQANQVQGYGSRDIIMSPVRPSPNRQQQMAPPPVPPPAPALNFPTPRINTDSGGSSPSRGLYGHQSRESTSSNPYIPRISDPGPSAGGDQWTDYRRPPSNSRMTSSSSFDYPSPGPQQLSPYLKPDNYPSSPHSPLNNPYDISPKLALDRKDGLVTVGTACMARFHES